MAVKKGLGRGLDMLIPGSSNTEEKVEDTQKQQKIKERKTANKEKQEKTSAKNKKEKEVENLEDIIEVDIAKIEPNRNQPRTSFDEDAIDELSESIKQYGVLQPLIVQKRNGYYEIVAGERRWRASKKANLKKLPVIVRNYEEQERLKISLIENIQREDLNAIEEAKAYEQLKNEYGLKQDEIAASVSKSRTAITNTMRLLKLDSRVQKMILENLISSGHGRTLLPLEDKELQYELALRILDENLSVRDIEKLVKSILKAKDQPPKEEVEKDEMVTFFENRMKEIIGSKVTIKEKKNNKGKIEIEYYSKDELQRIIDLIQSIHY
ncbi:MAG: ParB/RepB/Spo0J family partition protein [Eubacteriales bacterium]|nr:ParB/RepB/Spo0J family partition protein [Eubacteriales bacterium]